MNACRREFVDDVLLPRIEQYLLERTVVQLRFVVQFDLLAVARKDAVIGRGHGLQPLGEFLPPGVDGLAVFAQLHVVDLEHGFVGPGFQQAVAFGQHGVVTHHRTEIGAVQLRNEGVEIASALVGGVRDQRAVGRRHDHCGNQSHVVRKPFVLLAVALEHLAALAREAAHDGFPLAGIARIGPFDEEEVGAVADALPVGHRQRRLAHREVVNGVHDVGFARAVVAHQAVDAGAQREFLLGDVFEIQQRYFLQMHRTKIQKIRTRHCTL